MGNISNLATVGNYAFETGSLKVTFTFSIDHVSRRLKRITQGRVLEGMAEYGKELAAFGTENHSDGQRLSSNIEFGREMEVMNAIMEARTSLEEKIAAGQVTETE
ncbi:MAG: hypothetical protein IJ971_12070 [Bacteroidales bacterium]|nr:hypothetical protein [Bacteroidales bacterium]